MDVNSIAVFKKIYFYRWASEQAKARELGDVVEFARDLDLV